LALPGEGCISATGAKGDSGKIDKFGTEFPVRVPLATVPLDIWGSLQAGRRNVLKLILEIAARQPILSGTTGKRWHMVMDPEALRHILRDGVEDYPKSLVNKLILEPAIGNSMFVAEGADWHWQRRSFRIATLQPLPP
jgi:hypothetical protein